MSQVARRRRRRFFPDRAARRARSVLRALLAAEHAWYRCPRPCLGCQFCDGGLGHCTACNGFEGTLPTDCPGRPMSEAEQEAVYAGRLDFRAGRWVRRATGTVASHHPSRWAPRP